MTKGPGYVEVLITLSKASQSDAAPLTRRLSAKGLKNAAHLASIGIISGTIAADKLGLLRGEPGVEAVEVSGEAQIPPPDSDIQ